MCIRDRVISYYDTTNKQLKVATKIFNQFHWPAFFPTITGGAANQ